MKHIAYLVSVAVALAACSPPEEHVQIRRMEQRMFSIPLDSVAAAIPQLEKQFGRMFAVYCEGVLSLGSINDERFPQQLSAFLSDSVMNRAAHRVAEEYPDLSFLESQLSKAFTQYHRNFPERDVPTVYTLISGFNTSMVAAEGALGISLEEYLGRDEEMYIRLARPLYQRRGMDRHHIATDCMRAWAYSEWPRPDSADDVLSSLLYEGKIAYFVRQMLPNTPDSLIFNYTAEQTKWCHNNTRQMYSFLIEKQLLFSREFMTITKLVEPAPFTAFFTRESPGRAVVWLGYEIVKAYISRSGDSLEELMENNSYRSILQQAKFNP